MYIFFVFEAFIKHSKVGSVHYGVISNSINSYAAKIFLLLL